MNEINLLRLSISKNAIADKRIIQKEMISLILIIYKVDDEPS